MDDPGSWIMMIVCVLGTLVVSALNLGLRHISWVRLEDAFEKISQPQRLDWYRENLNQLISATAILRLIINIFIFMLLVYHSILDLNFNSEKLATVLWIDGLIAMGVLIIFAYAIPHAWARYAGSTLLARGFFVLRVLLPLGLVLAAPLNVIDWIVRRLAGVKEEEGNGKEEKQEELLSVVEEREKEGVVDEEEREMIESVLEFRDTTAGEIMTPRTDIVGIEVSTEFDSVIDLIIKEGHSRYPVYENSVDTIVGMIFAKDLLRHLDQPKTPRDMASLMRKPVFVPESKSLRDLLHDFQNQKNHFAVVLDEYGGTAGVVTIEDILEELVGEIADEYEDAQDEPFRKVSKNTYEIDARFHVDELNDKLELQIPEDEDYETIGGFAFARLGHIPENGEAFQFEHLRFTVLDAEQRRINRLQLVILPQKEVAE